MAVKIIVGNALDILLNLGANSVHCSVSSPPYYGLRKYEGSQQCEWPEIEYSPMSGLPPICVEAMTCALGHEPTIEAYVGHLVAIYRAVYRVLRGDGVAWVVMGDSFAQAKGHGHWECRQGKGDEHGQRIQQMWHDKDASDIGLKQGDLMMVPHRLALALQADGWIVRNDVVWHKKAPMPESVAGWRWQRHRIKVKKSERATSPYHEAYGEHRQGAGVAARAQREAYYEQGVGATEWIDCPGCPKCEVNDGYILKRGSWRHTRAHEFVFMLTKKMQYWADQEKVKEKQLGDGRKRGCVVSNRKAQHVEHQAHYNVQDTGTRNPRSVLTPKPEPFPGSHFAVYPTSLITNLIKAACPDRCCPKCGRGWSPMVERGEPRKHHGDNKTSDCARDIEPVREHGGRHGVTSVFYTGKSNTYNVLDYRPTCECGCKESVPGTCLDPFGGSGTTGLVCERLGLNSTLIEISLEYAEMAHDRVMKDAPLLNRVEVESAH